MIADARCQTFIDRDKERKLLDHLCREATLGRGSMVFLSGEPGIGKTRLIGEVARVAHAHGLRSATGYCLEHARSPLGPLSDIVRILHATDQSILRAARPVRHVLARLVPEVDSDVQAGGESDSARSQYVAITEMFRRASDAQPYLLVLEDAHWADLSTIEFLKFFAGTVGATNVLLLVSLRGEESGGAHLGPVIAQLRRQGPVHTIELTPLAPADMQKLVDAALGGQSISHDDRRRIRELADGNPLFAEELLASVFDGGAAKRELPASVREIFFERIRLLDLADRDILVEAAVLGQRFDPFFLARFTGRPVERILLALRHARALQLIVEDAGGQGAVFRHALIREALYESILAAEARRLHRRIVGELEALPDRDRHTAALAYHSWAARDAATALMYNEFAGDDAMRKLATNEAGLFFERAVSCAAETGAVAPRLYRKLADAYSGSGFAGRAIDLYTRAYESFSRDADVAGMAEVSLRIGREHTARGEGDAAMRWRLAGLETTTVLAKEPIRFDALTMAALAHAWRGEVDAAAELVTRAEAFEGQRTPVTQYNLHDAAAMVDMLNGQARRSIERYEAAGRDAVASGMATLAVRTYGNLYTFASVLGHTQIAAFAAAEALRLTDEVLVPMYRPYALVISGKANAAAGLLETTRIRFAQAEDAAAGLDSPRLDSQLTILALFLGEHLDEPALGERYADPRSIEAAFGSREPWWIGGIASAFADLYGRTGRTDDARALVARALTVLPAIVLSPEIGLSAARYGSDADRPIARARLREWSRVAAPEYARAYIDLFDAYGAQRDGASPVALATSAAGRFAALGLPLHAARAYELAGDRNAALQIYSRSGSSGDIARLNGRGALAGDGEPQFTKREREVFALVADGRSNREIATVMSISERTVESHIRSILSKVDGRSRVDLIKLAQARPVTLIRR